MGVVGNAKPEALPAVELDMSHLPKGTPRIAGTEVKWEEGTRAYRGTKVRLPRLAPAVRETMERYAVTAFQALALRDYARTPRPLRRPHRNLAVALPYRRKCRVVRAKSALQGLRPAALLSHK